MALFKGGQRLVAIDDATNKLEGLGHSAKEVQRIMDNALASVKGTAFGLDEAATTAAGAVASGIQPGKQAHPLPDADGRHGFCRRHVACRDGFNHQRGHRPQPCVR